MPTPGTTRAPSSVSSLGQHQVRPAAAFGEELRRRRQERQWSQRELGEAIHFSREYVALIERGARPPTPAFAERADTALDAGGILVRLFVCAARAGSNAVRRRSPRVRPRGRQPA